MSSGPRLPRGVVQGPPPAPPDLVRTISRPPRDGGKIRGHFRDVGRRSGDLSREALSLVNIERQGACAPRKRPSAAPPIRQHPVDETDVCFIVRRTTSVRFVRFRQCVCPLGGLFPASNNYKAPVASRGVRARHAWVDHTGCLSAFPTTKANPLRSAASAVHSQPDRTARIAGGVSTSTSIRRGRGLRAW